MKRLVDVLVAGFLLALAWPAMVAIALAHKIEGRVPVFWRSPRLGRGGARFELLTFRTMLDAEPSVPDGPDSPVGSAGTLPDRQTTVGRFIRNYSLDHLPMLLNVVRGDLSLIGPRPMEPQRVDLADPTWQRILSVRPGLASYAILRLARTYNRSPLDERLRLELEYVARQSLGFDLQIAGESLWALIASRGNVKARGRPSTGADRAA